MTSPFRTHIRQALANPNLQTALDNNAERRINARIQNYAFLPEDVQVMRQRAHNIRTDVVANLARYLDQFIANLQQNGIIVHQAADANESVNIVLDIAKQHNAHLISKSKTMVGEEIELNPALEAHGYEVVETDLGEYIVQIRHEHPAHIITPAVHLRREDVGKTFNELLGVPYTDDVATMVAVARRTLRDIFLKTDIGISGVNFGVAENGMLCVLTNEGNGRMVTTLPLVHIALMGIERLVPSLEDLASLLYLLPRSATGQKLTVYTNLIRQPAVDSDGPRERHLILLDNGRKLMSNSPFHEMLYCIRCGACINACPVFREIGGHAYVGKSGKHTPYPGPMGSVISPALFDAQDFGHLARASSY
ncbi:MAG: lactate utilization protein [Anaerolineales bacterium]|nr:lactate utilization protein [Anaerolineales bacterium]